MLKPLLISFWILRLDFELMRFRYGSLSPISYSIKSHSRICSLLFCRRIEPGQSQLGHSFNLNLLKMLSLKVVRKKKDYIFFLESYKKLLGLTSRCIIPH